MSQTMKRKRTLGERRASQTDGPPLGHGPGKEFNFAPVGLIPHTGCVLVAEVWSTHLPVQPGASQGPSGACSLLYEMRELGQAETHERSQRFVPVSYPC